MSNFSSYPQIFCYLLLDFQVKTGTRFSPRGKGLFKITEVKITRADCILDETIYLLMDVRLVDFKLFLFCLKRSKHFSFANSVDPNMMLHSGASDFGLYYLQTFL